MNQRMLKAYLSAYKQNLKRIRKKEQYKWQAVKHFQNNWDESADDFAGMLKDALLKTSNLMDSGNYYPRAVIEKAADKNPEYVRETFLGLFNENADLKERIEGFRNRIKFLNAQHNIGKKEFQDDRAILVYLTLRYPDDYYFYKFGMLYDFCKKTEHDYQPKEGAFANIEVYFEICAYLKTLILADDELVRKHRKYLEAENYIDSSFNILTQDFVYAVQSYLSDTDLESSNFEATVSPPKTNNLETPYAFDVSEPEVPDRVEVKRYRILRDTRKARGIKRLYEYRCQICGETIELSNGSYSEAHHIKPLGNPHNGPDHDSNIINVCPNHHVMLDYGAMRLDVEALNLLKAHQLNPEFIDYHNTEIYKGRND